MADRKYLCESISSASVSISLCVCLCTSGRTCGSQFMHKQVQPVALKHRCTTDKIMYRHDC